MNATFETQMDLRLIWIIAIGAICCWPAAAADGGWKFEIDERGHPDLTYSENGAEVFSVACGRAFGLHANYPGARDGKNVAVITIASSKYKMAFKGEIDTGGPDDKRPAYFTQWDLGYRRQDPRLFGKAWHAHKNRLLNLIDSGRPLTISAENKSYVLPPVDAPNWKAQFKQHC